MSCCLLCVVIVLPLLWCCDAVVLLSYWWDPAIAFVLLLHGCCFAVVHCCGAGVCKGATIMFMVVAVVLRLCVCNAASVVPIVAMSCRFTVIGLLLFRCYVVVALRSSCYCVLVLQAC